MPYAALSHYMRAGLLWLDALPPLSLYIHLPWCVRKCPYCDFNSHEAGAGRLSDFRHRSEIRPQRVQFLPDLQPVKLAGAGLEPSPAHQSSTLPAALEQRYIAALMADLHAVLPLVWGRPVHTIFIGGGTPSLFSPDAIAELISQLRSCLPLLPDCEITLEANPGTFERDRFKAFRAAGVNRLSIGVQSFNDAHLKALGRVHDRQQALAAVEEAAQHFETFNLDLMYALPGQSLADLQQDLKQALAFSPPHLSVYQLTLEANTFFAKFPPQLPDEDTAYDMLDTLVETTALHGLARYEVSAFAKPEHRCNHNLNYWQFGDYLGLGAGAHGKISFPHRVMRQVKVRDPVLYMNQTLQGDALAQEFEVPRADLPFEYMLGAMRLVDGVPLAQFQERTGLLPSTLNEALATARQQGLMTATPHQLQATAKGMDFLNDLQALFLPKGKAPERG